MSLGFSKDDIRNLTNPQIDLFYSQYTRERNVDHARMIESVMIGMSKPDSANKLIKRLRND